METLQIVGDSMMVRLVCHVSGAKPYKNVDEKDCLGSLLVGGMNMAQLLAKLEYMKTQGILAKSRLILLMIGTNDILQCSTMSSMEQGYMEIIQLLKSNSEQLVCMTLPPIPRLSPGKKQSKNLLQLNNFIKLQESESCKVMDVFPLFHDGEGNIREELFEREMGYGDQVRPDLLHWNKSGIELLYNLLLDEQVLTPGDIKNKYYMP